MISTWNAIHFLKETLNNKTKFCDAKHAINLLMASVLSGIKIGIIYCSRNLDVFVAFVLRQFLKPFYNERFCRWSLEQMSLMRWPYNLLGLWTWTYIKTRPEESRGPEKINIRVPNSSIFTGQVDCDIMSSDTNTTCRSVNKAGYLIVFHREIRLSLSRTGTIILPTTLLLRATGPILINTSPSASFFSIDNKYLHLKIQFVTRILVYLFKYLEVSL